MSKWEDRAYRIAGMVAATNQLRPAKSVESDAPIRKRRIISDEQPDKDLSELSPAEEDDQRGEAG